MRHESNQNTFKVKFSTIFINLLSDIQNDLQVRFATGKGEWLDNNSIHISYLSDALDFIAVSNNSSRSSCSKSVHVALVLYVEISCRLCVWSDVVRRHKSSSHYQCQICSLRALQSQLCCSLQCITFILSLYKVPSST